MNDSRENKPGRPRRCPPCPACGEDMMHGYGVKRWGGMVTRLYGCQHCQYTDTWIEPEEGGRGHWKKASHAHLLGQSDGDADLMAEKAPRLPDGPRRGEGRSLKEAASRTATL